MHPSKFSVNFHSGGIHALIYRKKGKLALVLVQIIAVIVLTYCLLSIGFWTEDSYSVRDMAKSYEETELFFRQVDTILSHKIAAQRNSILFETNGVFDGNKEVDIQSYGRESSSVVDLNTTYLLSDLLEFCDNGGWQRLREAVNQAAENEDRQAAGERLAGQSDILETIYPVTGISLAECSQWYSDSSGFVYNMYVRLNQVCQDISARYRQYSEEQEESWSKEAPSNLRFRIENTATGEVYSNFDSDIYEEAQAELSELESFTILYEGERSFNIMVTNQDHVLNDSAEEWFLNRRFVNTNEKVLVAVDLAYPVSDELRTYYDSFSNREGIIGWSLFGTALSLLILIPAFALSIAGAGLEEGRLAPKMSRVDRIPTELAAGIYLILAVLIVLIYRFRKPEAHNLFGTERLFWAAAASAVWLLFLSLCRGFTRRLRGHKLWHNSITRMLIYTWRRVTAARAASGQLLIAFIAVLILNFIFLLGFRAGGIIPLLVVDMLVLLFLLRDMAGKQSVWDGIQQISKGDLSYKIDTTTLTGESYEMAKAVNEMGDGLQEAVDAMIRNERLKAELITNVSHDLKTPLTSIVNYVDLLKREHLQGDRVVHYIEVLDQKSQRLKQLTEDLVEISKISSGNVELHMMRLQAQSMMSQAFGEFEERLEEAHLTPVFDFAKEPLFFMADGRQFWRVLENLIGNICKYALEETEISVCIFREEDMVRMELKNICRETLTISAEDLMGRFVRGDKSRNTEGSGLGLSIAKSLTELQNGAFQLELEGDEFRIRLSFPYAQQNPES